MPNAKRNHLGSAHPIRTIRFVCEMQSSIQQNLSRGRGQAELSTRCPAALQRLQVASQHDAAPDIWCNGFHGHGDNRSVNGISSPALYLNPMDKYEKFSLGRFGSHREIPSAGFPPEGWVRPSGVGPRAPRHNYVSTQENLTAQVAGSYQIKHFAMTETE